MRLATAGVLKLIWMKRLAGRSPSKLSTSPNLEGRRPRRGRSPLQDLTNPNGVQHQSPGSANTASAGMSATLGCSAIHNRPACSFFRVWISDPGELLSRLSWFEAADIGAVRTEAPRVSTGPTVEMPATGAFRSTVFRQSKPRASLSRRAGSFALGFGVRPRWGRGGKSWDGFLPHARE